MAEVWVKPDGRSARGHGGRGRGPWVLTTDKAKLAEWAEQLPACGEPESLQAHLEHGARTLRAGRRPRH
eukprot:10200835-Prorocentrum_lima.AAC.1